MPKPSVAAQFGKRIPPTVQISVPSGSHWHAAFGMDMIMMILDTLSYEIPGIGRASVSIKNIRGSTLWKQRTDLLLEAQKAKCTHALFVDTDQTFPANMLRRLLWHKKEVVAANVAVKTIPSMSTARQLYNGKARPVFTTGDSKGLEQVWRVGTGVMLIDLNILKWVPRPWFSVSGDAHGEDWWFCQQIEKAKIPIFIDHDVSWEVGHLGDLAHHHWHIPPEVIAETKKIFEEGTEEEQARPLAAAVKRLGMGVG